ncbi:protein Aatf [Lucilia cuprina]|uniref:protein Aatf n=1 Tax=Lucilia cuprina TaxID=7375 RepID=UPI001F0633A2|nr:protein Aatf [Lucilia cuprina]
MLKKPKNKQKTVAEKIAQTLMHPNESGSDSDSADEATAPRVIEYNDEDYELPEARSTEFRKRNVKLLSEQSAKYKGKIVSRKDFESEEEDDIEDEELDEEEEEEEYENSDSSDNEEALNAFSKALKSKQNKKETSEGSDLEEEFENEDEQEDDDEAEDQEQDSEEEQDSEDDDESENDDDEETEVISKVNHEAEIQKGLCVQNQLRIWERLLELRINLQKILNKTNQLPDPEELKDLEHKNNKYKELQQTTSKQTCQLLQNLISLKTNLCTQFSEVDKAMKPCLKRPSPFKDYHKGEPPMKQVSLYLEENFENFRPYRNEVLLKWDDRTKLLTPGAGSKKKTFNEEYDIIKKIDNALINKSVLKEKSQQLKNSTQAVEAEEENKRNPNIYDDSDFYHQQLRELIEYKANTTSNMSEVTKQFLELQKLRQKMKKKVDTRASKGRKLRYIVHNKLINFMAPHDNSSWTMESIDELSKSLFV